MTNIAGMGRVALRVIATAALAVGLVAGLGVLSPGVARAASGPPCTSTKVRACVDISRGKAWLMSHGKVAYGPATITSGRPGYRTSIGTFHVTRKDKDHISSIYHVPMPYSVFFHGGEAFHEGSRKVQSHGCIHLSHKSAVRFYKYLHVGDVVQIHR
ncbi:MAG TPA: L,D-transpeptidase [Streptosporangiales bacterium]